MDKLIVEVVALVVVLNQLDEVRVKADELEAVIDHFDQFVVNSVDLVVLDHWTRS